MLNKTFFSQTIAAVIVPLLLVACANNRLNETPKPLPETLPSVVSVDIPWWHILADEFSAKAYGHLKPTVVGDVAYTAVASGEVFKITQQGEVSKVGQHAAQITSALTIDGDEFLFADAEGKVHLTDAQLTPVWSANLNAVAVEAPLMTAQRIFVQTIDGRVNAIERLTGRLLWSYQDAEPSLTVSGTSAPVLIDTAAGSAIVTGLANGKLVALSVQDGSVIWEYRITRASGKTDVSRLVDVDAQVTLVGDRLIATAYQGDLVVVDTQTGAVRQAKAFSSYRSIQALDGVWYGVNAQSHVVALDPATLNELWVNTDLEYHQLSELLIVDGQLLATDRAGFLHVFDGENGQWLGSRHIDWRGSKTDPVAFAQGVLVQGHSTRLKYIEIVR